MYTSVSNKKHIKNYETRWECRDPSDDNLCAHDVPHTTTRPHIICETPTCHTSLGRSTNVLSDLSAPVPCPSPLVDMHVRLLHLRRTLDQLVRSLLWGSPENLDQKIPESWSQPTPASSDLNVQRGSVNDSNIWAMFSWQEQQGRVLSS